MVIKSPCRGLSRVLNLVKWLYSQARLSGLVEVAKHRQFRNGEWGFVRLLRPGNGGRSM